MKNKTLIKITLLSLLSLNLVGCVSSKPLVGGRSKVDGNKIEMIQSENPASVSKQETEVIRSYELPVGTVISNKSESIILIKPLTVIDKIKTKTELGAAQKDYAREIGAKLSSMKPVQYVGIALLLFGIASFVYPPLRLVVGSVTTSAVITSTGLGLIVLPILIVGNEILILVGGLVFALGYAFIYRHGKSSGEVKTLKKWIDKNGNGKFDTGEGV